VQVGDPFAEKLLMEASLELITSGLIVAIQDMGAAGLTSSSAEMAARGGVGVEIDTALVPTREPGMTPYEILLSESQERMLVVAEPDKVEAVRAVCEKWELAAAAIGRVTDDGIFRVRHGDLVVAAIPGRPLVDDCPVYHPEAREAEIATHRRDAGPTAAPSVGVAEALERLLDTPTIASKRWVYEQYDSTVQASTVIGPGGDAGVFTVPGTGFGVAVTVDCNARFVALDPYEGGKACVAEAARNVACTGAVPLGITDCLNFGNPEKPDIFFQFTEACRGIGDACRAFETPVTGGNVSFYNESPTGAVDPTPTIGMVGLLPDVTTRVPSHFAAAGDRIVLLGRTVGQLGGSMYWSEIRDFVGGRPPAVDLAAERALQQLLVAAAAERLLRSAHDCSDGGLAVALAEAAIGGPYATAGVGAAVDLAAYADGLPPEALLYAEDGARAIVSCAPASLERLLALAAERGVPAAHVGEVGPANGALEVRLGARAFRWNVADLRRTYFEAIPRRMRTPEVERAETEHLTGN
jgi:phosphoribosylformylglycinamidine synthase